MPHPSPAAIAAPPDPAPTKKPRGNPNLHLAPRCGARARSSCPCRSPAIQGKLRCRMHGGRSTGPRTPKGLEDLRAARTIHGNAGAEARALDRYRLTLLRRSRVNAAAMDYQAHLPPAFVARLYGKAPELLPPPGPTGGITAAADRMRRRAVAAALAPWKQAIATARAARGAARLARPCTSRPTPPARRRRIKTPCTNSPPCRPRRHHPRQPPTGSTSNDLARRHHAKPPPDTAPPGTAKPARHRRTKTPYNLDRRRPQQYRRIKTPCTYSPLRRPRRHHPRQLPARGTGNSLARRHHARPPPDTAPPGTAKPARHRRTKTPCNLARCRPQQYRRIKTPCTYSRPRRPRRHHPRQPPARGTGNSLARRHHARPPPDTAPPGTAKPARNSRTKTPYNLRRCRPQQHRRIKTPCTYSRPHRARHPPGLPSRAARRRWKHLQRLKHLGSAVRALPTAHG